MKASMAASPSSVSVREPLTNQLVEGQASRHEALPRLAGNSLVVLVASIFGNGLNYLFGMYFARALGPADFGLYALGMTVFNIAVLFAPLGMETAVMKFVSHHAGPDGMASARKTIASGVGVAAGFGLLLALCLAFSSDLLSRTLFGKPELSPIFLLLALGVPLAAVSAVAISSLQALGQIRTMALIRNGLEPVGKFLLAAIAVSMGFGLAGVLGSLLIIFLVSLVISIWYLKRLTNFRFERLIVPGGLEAKALLAFSMPLVISNLFGIVAPRSDMLTIGAHLASQDIAVYAVASQTAAVLVLILGAFDTAIMPTIGGLLAKQEMGQLAEVSKAAARWAMTLSLFVFVQLALFGGDLLRLFGPTFESGALCLAILAAGHLVGSASVSSTGIILMSGHSKVIMLNSIVIGVALIVSNVVLVPRFGIIGAACATSVCIIASSLLCAIEAKRFSGVIPYSWRHLKPLGAGVLTLAMGFLLKSTFTEASALLLAPIMAVVYAGLLVGFGLEARDRDALAQMFPRVEPMMRCLPRGLGGDR
jgi:O-antigen/teichoic acid export membrane protein